MINIDSIDNASRFLAEGYLLARVTMDYSGITKECLVAGVLMGLTEDDWWYALVSREGGDVCGIVQRKLFIELYRSYYIEETKKVSSNETYFALNGLCAIQEALRYQHKIDSWSEATSSPVKTASVNFR